MAWKMIGKPQVLKCTHALAAKFSGMEPAPNDRPMRTSVKKAARNAIIEGRFRTCEWACVKCKQTGKCYRVNGKHTSTVLSEMNGEAPKNLHIVVEEYEADTLEDVAKLYSTFDPSRSSRTQSDINYCFAASIEELNGIPRKVINTCATAMFYHSTGGKAGGIWSSTTQESKAQRIVEGSEFVQFTHVVIGGKIEAIRKLMRGPVVAAMYATWLKDRKAASDFWTLVREENHVDAKDPTRKLARFLTVAAVRSDRAGGISATQHEMYVKCLHAWNAWRRNVPTSLQYYADKPAPDVV